MQNKKNPPPFPEPRPPAKILRPPIPDPLGDDTHVVGSGRLTAGSRERQGLLRAGSTPVPDGGLADHPIHDESLEDLDADAYEEEFDAARKTGFEPREDDDARLVRPVDELDPAEFRDLEEIDESEEAAPTRRIPPEELINTSLPDGEPEEEK
jgi:hypothetical protein